jgi:hypothetical protein
MFRSLYSMSYYLYPHEYTLLFPKDFLSALRYFFSLLKMPCGENFKPKTLLVQVHLSKIRYC